MGCQDIFWSFEPDSELSTLFPVTRTILIVGLYLILAFVEFCLFICFTFHFRPLIRVNLNRIQLFYSISSAMDLRRKKPVDMQGVRRSRASHSGKVTSIWEKLKALDYEQPEDLKKLNTVEVRGYLRTLTKTEAGFTTSLAEAQEFAPLEEEEAETFQNEEDEAAETFTQALDTARNLGQQIQGYKTISTAIRDFNTDLEALKDALQEAPDTDNSSAMAALFSTMREQWVKEELNPEHPLQNELDDCRKNLTSMERDVAAARSKANPAITSTTPTAPTGFREVETKLPTIDVPTFSGDIMQWCSFWTSFEATIDSKKMAKTSKLAYLRKAIRDPESQTLLYSPQEDNDFYDEVVASLQLRFNRTKEIHRKLVQTLVHLPATKNTRMDLRKRVDELRHIMSSLKHTGHFDLQSVLTSLVYSTLPLKLQTLWDQTHKSTKAVVPIHTLISFISEHAETLPAGTTSTNDHPAAPKKFPHKKGSQSQSQPKNNVHVAAPTQSPVPYKWDCLLCTNEKHPLYQCSKWGSYSISQKTAHVTAHKLCNNCLAVGHTTAACKSIYRCKECRQKHHTSLHQQQQEQVTSINHSSATSRQVPDALMTTAKLLLIGPDGSKIRARALIDSGAGISLITQRAAQMLNLPLEPARLRLSVAQGETSKPLKHLTSLQIAPLHNQTHKLDCHPAVATAVTSLLPARPLPEVTELQHLIGLPLADTSYNIPGKIDILLGADMASAIIQPAIPRRGKPTEPLAQSTIFRWTLSGPIPGHQQEETVPAYHQLPILQSEPTPEPSLEELLKAVLHEKGEPGDAAPTQIKELHEQVEQQYLNTVSYSPQDSRYTVTLPRKESQLKLGNSRTRAVSRFISNERTNLRRGTHSAFQDGVESYLLTGHAEKVPPEEQLPPDHFYMPMHAVFKDSSSSTKLRVVFDGSATTSSGLSLNQSLHIGPTLQSTLSDTLIKFRSYPIALNADISKMYREVGLADQDKDLHRFVWRKHPSEQLQDYRMRRVTFGVSASPYLAVRTLHKIAEDHGEGYPEATQHITSSFYIDDFLGGAATPEEALKLFHQIRAILMKGGFHLRKWRSSSQEVVQQIPDELLEKDPIKLSTSMNVQTNSKALGLIWDSNLDVMSPSISIPSKFKPTKRGLVSAIYQTYDILGWISPTVLLMKLMIQQLWKNGHEWDAEAPVEYINSYTKWKNDLPVLRERTLPRYYSQPGKQILHATLHGFADASKTAYGAVVYYRTTYSNHPPTTSLVASKTKLAKAEGSTIPRLELCAALLLAKLLQSVGQTLLIPPSHWHAWSDSSTVLAWLDGNVRHHPIYISNRVEQTLHITTPYIWHYVPTAQDPADCASRGMKPKDLLQHTLWWEGPPWLQQDPLPLPRQPPRKPLPDAGLPVYVVLQNSSVAEHISTLDLPYLSIIATAAWCRRYLTRLKEGRPNPDQRTSYLTPEERKAAEHWLFKEAQRKLFPKDILSLEKNKPLSRDSRLKLLNPFLDSQQILRVGGRIGNSQMSPSQKHPIILDGKDSLIEKYFHHIHQSQCHCGPSLLLSYTGIDLHILGARRLSRKICAKCVFCRKQRPQLESQLMGDLPSSRFAGEGKPFLHTGLDYAGPFKIKTGSIRKPIVSDAYVCVFVCMASNAVHLEVVSDQTTAAFQATLDRFIARRGCPTHLYSDNGPNFIGAKNDLAGFYSFLQQQTSSQEIQNYLATHHQVTWHTIPPRSPHMGGLWEAAVKAMKTHLARVIGTAKLTFEELNTLIIKVEACLNSRPLLPIHCHDPDGIEVLTPSHLLIGKGVSALPEDPVPNENPHLLKTWRRCQAMAHHFWSRWAKEYLNSLQARTKWQKPHGNLQVGDIVAVKPREHFLSCHWPLGRILKVFPGKDGIVRVVELKTASGTVKRAITEVALIFREEEEDAATPAVLQQGSSPAPQHVQAPSTSWTTPPHSINIHSHS